MTETEEGNARHRNGGAATDACTRDDVFDNTYKEKDGPKPPRTIVWKNVILMSLLHFGALYALCLVPSATSMTLAWCK